MMTPAKKVSEARALPACLARHAAARLRRASVGPILAPPPVRAKQAYHRGNLNAGKTYFHSNLLAPHADKGYMRGKLTDLF